MIIPIKYNIRSLLQRKNRTILTVLSIAAVTATFICMTALTSGLRAGFKNAGADDTVVVLQKSSSYQGFSSLPKWTMNIIKYSPHIMKKDNRELVSPEVYVASWVKYGREREQFIMIRGVQTTAFDVYDNVRIVEGSGFSPGKNVMAGKLALKKLNGAKVGDFIEMEGYTWKIAGIFEDGGSVTESEIWTDLNDMMVASNRSEYSTYTIKVDNRAHTEKAAGTLSNDTRINVTALPSKKYYVGRGELFGKLSGLGIIVAMIISIGAVFGGMNTMYTAIANRFSEIGTLRVLGFSRKSIFLSFIIESLTITLTGGLIGIALGAFSGIFTLHLPMSSTQFSVTPVILFKGIILSLIIGILGGILPAWRGSRIKLLEVLRAK